MTKILQSAFIRKHIGLLFLGAFLFSGCVASKPAGRVAGPWDLASLKQTPVAEWGSRTGLVQEVYFKSEPFQGKATRVFAYVARPSEGKGPFPAMVLVHGGGGKAFREWAEHWAKRGYVAISMDTAGCGPEGRLSDGGPGQGDEAKFHNFTPAETREMWTYHAVAAVVRAHSLLRSMPEVDPNRIGLTGISWGGYLTCIVAGIDDRFKVAVPVYGCGFLGDNSVWTDKSLAAMNPEARKLWLKTFDPSEYVGGVHYPILFLDGSNDFAYPLDSFTRTSQLVPQRFRHTSIILNMPHGHIWTFGEVDAFVDGVVRNGQPLPKPGGIKIKDGVASTTLSSSTPMKKAELIYTVDSGPWQKRQWKSVPAGQSGKSIVARLPEQRPLAFYLCVTDERGLRTSTTTEELADR
ncbi:MAG: alpha/beta fold hydrolase [Verrucomicrobia bacterium]|nr:alpha/beta fold hydrolase [Verrucomicrobiota bacterium]